MRLVLLGPPGAGKGTQARTLTVRLRIPHVSTGEMLRAAAEAGSPSGMAAKEFTDQGLLVPDAMILAMVGERLAAPDARAGFLLDGFPRTVHQAQALEQWLKEACLRLDAVINLVVPDETIVERISQRRVCPACHETYHLSTRPPRTLEVCDACGHALTLRDDDRAELVRERLRVYHERTEPLIAYYRERCLLRSVDGDRPVAEVTAAVLELLAGVGKRHPGGQP